jgi:hypothetical protein
MKLSEKVKVKFAIVCLIFVVLILLIFVSTSVFNIFSDSSKELFNTLIFEIKDEHDDGRTFTVENSPVGYGDEDGEWAKLQLSPTYSFGVRFTNITIPENVTIKDAYVQLYFIGTIHANHPNCKIYGDDVANSENFTNIGVLDICGRNYTDSFVLWNTSLEYGQWVKTPSLTSVLNEVMNDNNWTSGNPIAILFVSQGIRGYSATFDNFENGSPAKLYVKWE